LNEEDEGILVKLNAHEEEEHKSELDHPDLTATMGCLEVGSEARDSSSSGSLDFTRSKYDR